MAVAKALDEDEFLAIKQQLAATPRGRLFLKQYEERSHLYAKEEMTSLVDELRGLLKRNATHAHRQAELLGVLRREFEEISKYIQQTREEIAALRPEDDGSSWIKTATGELDAIVTATEQATFDILGAAEEVQRLVGELPNEGDTGKVRATLEDQVTIILTACSFQDITGQRTTKVVNALRFLEERVNSMIDIWGTDGLKAVRAQSQAQDERPDAHLLNGPALAGTGISQDDVDQLMSDFGSPKAEPAPSPGTAQILPMPKPAAPRAPAPKAAAVAAPMAAPPPAANGGAASQADIDALFD